MTNKLFKLFLVLMVMLPILGAAQDKATFDRGINSITFVPKGQWLTGGSFSYSDYGLSDYTFLVMEDAKADGYTLNVSPFLGYFVKDNMALGARFGYKRTLLRFDKININLGEDFLFEINDYYNLQHVYYGTFMMRNYTSIGDSKVFGLFNELRVTLGGGQGKVYNGKGNDLSGMYQDIFEFQLGAAPGLVAFMSNEVAAEVSVGVLGFQYRKIKQTKDNVYNSSYSHNRGNFKIDLFSIHIGVAFYIPTLKPNVGKILRRKPKKTLDPLD